MIIFDGWSLVHHPNSPAALHLLTLLEYHPPEFPALVALPGEPFEALPSRFSSEIIPAASGEHDLSVWETRLLPELARRMGAGFIHLASLKSGRRTYMRSIVSPSSYDEFSPQVHDGGFVSSGGWLERLRDAYSYKRSGIKGIFWPEELPSPNTRFPIIRLPIISPSLLDRNDLELQQNEIPIKDLPETYILCHAPFSHQELLTLIQAWSWAVGSVGYEYPLLVAGLDLLAQQALLTLAKEYKLDGTIRNMPLLSRRQLAQIYQGCSALFHPAEISPWGSPVHLALAFGKPIVGLEMPRIDALVGPAAYLIPDAPKYQPLNRSLGAAIVSVIVDEELSTSLVQVAQKRAAIFQSEQFSAAISAVYMQLLA